MGTFERKKAALDGQRITSSDESPTKGGSTLRALDKMDSPTGTMLTRLVAGLSLPKLEIEPFSGLPGQYVSFIEAFRSNIEPNLLINRGYPTCSTTAVGQLRTQ